MSTSQSQGRHPTSEVCKLPRLWSRTVCLLALALICGIGFWGFSRDPPVRRQLGPIQILERPDDIWLFVQVDRIVRRSDLASPNVSTTVDSQWLFVVDARGALRQKPVKVGPNFSTNTSEIFWFGGRVLPTFRISPFHFLRIVFWVQLSSRIPRREGAAA